jgi:RNA polymerase sigma-70 factor (ECF subfamily)
MLATAIMSAGANPAPLRPADGEWRTLIERAARGEQEALARLYDQTSRLVYGVALRILGRPEDAEEVTLDVYSQVWRSAKDYSSQRGTPLAWLIMIARSRALDRVRSRDNRQSRETGLDEVAEVKADSESAEQATWMGQVRARVRRAMGLLPPEQRSAIELAFFGGLSHAELAVRLGEPLGTVKTRIRLGMMRIRQALTEEGGMQ